MEKLLEVEGVTASYGSIKALEDISLEVREGEIVAMLGANGAGKTTTLRVISGQLAADCGSVKLRNQELLELEPENIVDLGVTLVPEGRRIFSGLTVLENLKAGSYSRRQDEDWRDKLDDIYSYFPVLEERQGQKGGTLSGGEQQMLAIARGLMAGPELMLLDEPSLGLAPLIVDDIFQIIRDINDEGTTIFIVEQNATLALDLADRAYVMETGSIVEGGEAEKLAEQDVVREAYLGKEK